MNFGHQINFVFTTKDTPAVSCGTRSQISDYIITDAMLFQWKRGAFDTYFRRPQQNHSLENLMGQPPLADLWVTLGSTVLLLSRGLVITFPFLAICRNMSNGLPTVSIFQFDAFLINLLKPSLQVNNFHVFVQIRNSDALNTDHLFMSFDSDALPFAMRCQF
jgi:hypothetical protein